MNEKMLKLLYRSFDVELNAKEKKRLTEALKGSLGLQVEKKKIAVFRQNIVCSKKICFKPFFIERTMARLQSEKNIGKREFFFEALMSLFKPLAIAATILILIITGFNMGSSGRISLDSAFAIPNVSIEEAFDPIFLLMVR